MADPLDALVLQIQGSGRLRFQGSDGRVQTVRLAYAGHNDQPYASVGRWLINQGELKADGANWPAIKDWAKRNPKRVQEMLWANPRVVFFREEPLPDPSVGPRGAMGVPLTPGRSIAVDPQSVPYGTPVVAGQHRAAVDRPRCSAWCWRRTPAAPSPARCAPTTSGAGPTVPRRRPGA